jgi:membrane-associated phospholipid phosphatase
MKIRVLIIITSLFASGIFQSAEAQFRDSQVQDWGIIAGAAFSEIFLTAKQKKFNKKNTKPIQGKEPPGILFFDRATIGNSSLKAGKLSDGMLYTSVAGYFAIAPVYSNKHSWYMGLETLAITDLANIWIKMIVKRKRPFTNSRLTMRGCVDCGCEKYDLTKFDARLSFYSGHTAQVAAFSYFTMSMLWFHFSDFRKDRQWAYLLGGAIPAFTGYLRTRAGKHYPSDVIVGYLAGAAAGYLVPVWHKNDNEFQDLSNLNDNMVISLIGGAGTAAALLIISKVTKPPAENCFEKAQSSKNYKLSLTPLIGRTNGLSLRLSFN